MSDMVQQMIAMLDANPMIEEHYPCAVEFKKAAMEGRVNISYPDPRRCIQCKNYCAQDGKGRKLIWPKFCPHCGKENPSGT